MTSFAESRTRAALDAYSRYNQPTGDHDAHVRALVNAINWASVKELRHVLADEEVRAAVNDDRVWSIPAEISALSALADRIEARITALKAGEVL